MSLKIKTLTTNYENKSTEVLAEYYLIVNENLSVLENVYEVKINEIYEDISDPLLLAKVKELTGK